MSDAVDADLSARIDALDVRESVLLQAPAGSGKTEVLTQRFLGLLAIVDEPEEILAITFTRKAAAEMRRRVLRILDGDIDPQGATAARLHALQAAALARAQLRGWDLLELRSRLRIQTIDSLNHEVARSMPLLGVGSGPLAVVDDAEALYREAARAALAETAPDEEDSREHAEFADALDRMLRRLDNQMGKAEDLLTRLLGQRAQWLPAITQHDPEVLARAVERGLESIARDALRGAVEVMPAATLRLASELLRSCAQHLSVDPKEGSNLIWLETDTALDAQPRNLAAWWELADLLLTLKGGWRLKVTKNDGIPPKPARAKAQWQELTHSAQRTPGLQEVLLGLRDLPSPVIEPGEADALAALARVLRRAAVCLQQEFIRGGRVDHVAIAGYARTGLGGFESPSELALRRAAALKHLLVDEFQDTSVEQLRLLERLILGWAPDDGRSLFAVGDPMQSIYQFRSAEVGLFLRARENGIGDLPLRPLSLTRNFRSDPALIDWANRTFAAVFPPRDDVRESSVSFLPAMPGRSVAGVAADLPEAVTVTALPSPDEQLQARALAQRAVEARQRRPGCSIAVLVQTGNLAPPVIAALRARGFSVRGVELEPMARQPAVRDVVSLGSALLHPCDRIAWLAVLRAPHVGLSLADLLHIAQACDPDEPLLDSLESTTVTESLSTDGALRLARCIPLLRAAVASRARGRFVPALRALWLQLGGSAALSSQTEWEQVESYLEALQRRADDGARLDGAMLRDLAERLRVGAATAEPDSIEVLTIHKAKGLEWDVVLLPGLHRGTRSDTRPLLAWIELPRPDDDVDLLMAALSVGAGTKSDRLGKYIGKLRRQRLLNERSRLAYVAATRARCELHLFAHAALDHDGNPKQPRESMLKTLWPAIAGAFTPGATPVAAPAAADPVANGVPSAAVGEERDALDAPTPAPPATCVRLPADWQPPTEPALPVLPRIAGAAAAVTVPMPEFLWVGREARAIGTVVHGELERCGDDDPSPVDDTARRSLWRQRLRELGVSSAATGAAIERIGAVLGKVRTDAGAAWIFATDQRAIECELRLSGLVDGELRDVVLDRTFIDADGVRWVIDYKTGGHEGGDVAGFVAQELERYAPQLRLYARLAAGLGPEPVRCALYYPVLQQVVVVPN